MSLYSHVICVIEKTIKNPVHKWRAVRIQKSEKLINYKFCHILNQLLPRMQQMQKNHTFCWGEPQTKTCLTGPSIKM